MFRPPTPLRVYVPPTNTVLGLRGPHQHCFKVYVGLQTHFAFLLAPPPLFRAYVVFMLEPPTPFRLVSLGFMLASRHLLGFLPVSLKWLELLVEIGKSIEVLLFNKFSKQLGTFNVKENKAAEIAP